MFNNKIYKIRCTLQQRIATYIHNNRSQRLMLTVEEEYNYMTETHDPQVRIALNMVWKGMPLPKEICMQSYNHPLGRLVLEWSQGKAEGVEDSFSGFIKWIFYGYSHLAGHILYMLHSSNSYNMNPWEAFTNCDCMSGVTQDEQWAMTKCTITTGHRSAQVLWTPCQHKEVTWHHSSDENRTAPRPPPTYSTWDQ